MTVLVGDCLEVMPSLDAASFDAIVTDPPYGLGFMGKDWDHGVPAVPFWEAALRVAKPGAHLVAFGGTRTYHRLTVAIEDAGWEIRDCLSWLYGSGFPKSHDVSKALDKTAGHWRGRAGAVKIESQPAKGTEYERTEKGDAITPAAAAACGWGTALKPAWEPIILARKPLSGTVAANWLEHGTGALNIDACRIGVESVGWRGNPSVGYSGGLDSQEKGGRPVEGRWPANVALDADAAALLDAQSDGASRFFYTAKAARSEREAGLREAGLREAGTKHHIGQLATTDGRGERRRANTHPTVKPLDLMQWLCRLVTPRGGLILDPFCGSGTTGRAAVAEGFRFIGIEKDAEYAEIARARILEYAPLFGESA